MTLRLHTGRVRQSRSLGAPVGDATTVATGVVGLCRRLCVGLCVLALAAGAALAQNCSEEFEPNDTPMTAVDLSDARCFVGELPGQDQDAWVWNVTEEDAAVPWTMTVEGIAGQLTKIDVIRVTFTEDGAGVSAAQTVFTAGTSDGTPNTSEPFLVTPGDRWFFGVSKSGGEGQYVVQLTPGDRISRGRDRIGREEVDHAFGVAGVLDGATTFSWILTEDEAARRWGLELRAALGATLEATLEAPDGSAVGTVRAASGMGRLDSLGLEAGTYTVRLAGAGESSATAILDAVSQGVLTDGNEIEPNNDRATANVLPFGEPLSGGGGDLDVYVLDVDAETASEAWDLTLDADGNVELDLRNDAGDTLQQRHGASGTMPGLHFTEGRYWLRVDASRDAQYTLQLTEGSVAEDGFEVEPNDVLAAATPLPENLGVRGRVGTQDVDVFRFATEGEAQLFRFQAIGDGAGEITLYNGGGVQQQSLRGDGRIRLDNVVLLPGTHYVSVGRGEGEYALRALPLGPAPEPEEAEPTDPDVPLASPDAAVAEPEEDEPAETPDVPDEPDLDAPIEAGPPPPPGRLELEPNDDDSRAELLVENVVHVGQIPDGDQDYYRFFLPNDGRVRIEFVGAEGSNVFLDLLRQGDRRVLAREGRAIDVEAALIAGDYFVDLEALTATEGYYQLRLSHLDPLAAAGDEEPNDELPRAATLPSTRRVEGTVGGRDGSDFVRLPAMSTDGDITVTLTAEDGSFTLYDVHTGGSIRHEDQTRGEGIDERRFAVPADKPTAVRVTGNGSYVLEVEFGGGTLEDAFQPVSGGPARLEPATPAVPVAAYWHVGQVVESSVTITHEGDAPTTYRLVGHVSSLDAELELPETVDVGPGESVEIPITIRLQPDLRDDAPLRVTVGAIDTSTFGTIDTAAIALEGECTAAPAAQQRIWPVPTLLVGRFNVAFSGFGSVVLGDDPRPDLIDGRTAPSRVERTNVGDPIDVDLPGDEPHRLLGTILNPQGQIGPAGQLKRFRIDVSLDGATFTPAFEGTLGAARREQAFVFPEPVEARYARLVALSAQDGSNRAALGEWKLVAEDAPITPINLLEPRLGGQTVWSSVRPAYFDNSLVADGEGDSINDRIRGDLVWVVGFHHGRAAQIERLAWTPNEQNEGEPIGQVEVAASVTGPAGPFEPVTTWEPRTGDLVFDTPLWARYLRLTVPEPEGGLPRGLLLPDALAAYERTSDDTYRSIVAEWGAYGREAVYEWLEADGGVGTAESSQDAADDRGSATPLASGGRATGTVAVAEDVDWYRIDVPEGENLVEITLAGAPTVDYRYALYDADGEPVVYDEVQEGDRIRLSAFTESEALFLELLEPKRSVIFAWDTSGSVSPYQAITYNSLAGFARDVDPEREFTQLLAYDSPSPRWLLPYWSADPLRVQSAINEFDRNADSSDSFIAMATATNALADRDGTRAILLMTDAETGGFERTPELWSALGEVRPRVFTFEISTASSDWTQDLMQNWASVNNGHYSYARNVGDFDIGFRRASCHLRRAKAYTVDVATRYEAPPGPGTITVLPSAGAAKPAIEVILDASGSMGVLLPDGTPRIDAARDTLRRLVAEGIEEGTPFALRAFGHVMPSTCDQELVVPLEPLDREAAGAAIAGIEPKLLSQTPIADALRAAATDLENAGGPVAVVLITDGEESCGGDPEAALAELRAAGVDVSLSIVSLALDDAAAEERFANLATIGNGTYTDVGDPDGLAAALEASLAVPFEVLGPDGSVVAAGRVGGEPVSLPRGLYTVRVPGSPPTLIRDVRVPGDSNVNVAVGPE